MLHGKDTLLKIDIPPPAIWKVRTSDIGTDIEDKQLALTVKINNSERYL